MSAKSIIGYVFLFVFLFLLIGVHSGFTLLFFLAIIIVVAYKIKQRKKSKSNTSRSYPSKNYQKGSFAYSISNHEDPSTENDGILIENEPELDVSTFEAFPYEEPKTSHDSPTSMSSKIIDSDSKIYQKSTNPTFPLKTNFTAPTESVKTQKKSFDRYYWSLSNSQSFETKKLKFERALEYCKENNLGSKAKLRRLNMKIDRWNVENERDVEAMIPDYDSLIDLIEEFETKED